MKREIVARAGEAERPCRRIGRGWVCGFCAAPISGLHVGEQCGCGARLERLRDHDGTLYRWHDGRVCALPALRTGTEPLRVAVDEPW